MPHTSIKDNGPRHPITRAQTQSLCPVCLSRLPAVRRVEGRDIVLVKTCPEHGEFRTPVWRGAPAFDEWQRDKIPVPPSVPLQTGDKGCPFDCGLCADHGQRSCTVIIEVTQRCDLACPVCYAAAPAPAPDPSLDALAALFRRAADTAPGANIQLSGGEPTLRDDLPAIVALGRELGFSFIQVNTNGLRLGRDRVFVESLKQAGLASVFLQFDGTDDAIYRRLRGGDMVAAKQAAIDACGRMGIGVVLVPTLVPGINTHAISDLLEAALARVPVVRGIHFQPISYFGRYPAAPTPEMRLTLPEVIQAIETQSHGVFQASNFGPPGCENALCSFHGQFMLLADNQVRPLKSGSQCCSPPIRTDEGATRAMAAVARQWAGREHLTPPSPPGDTCTCKTAEGNPDKDGVSAPLNLDNFLDRARTHTFSVSAMAFQDAWSVALDRVQDCCIHSMSPDGRLIPFCLYNLTAADGRRLYRPS